jgi:hypothetical protein
LGIDQKQIHITDLKLDFIEAIDKLRTAFIFMIVSSCISILFVIIKYTFFDAVFFFWFIQLDISRLVSSIFFLIGFIMFFRSIRKLTIIFQPSKNNILSIIQMIIIGFFVIYFVEYILLIIAVNMLLIDYYFYFLSISSIVFELAIIGIFISLSIFFRKSKSINGMYSRLLILPFIAIPFIIFKILAYIFSMFYITTLVRIIDFNANIFYYLVYAAVYIEIIFAATKINQKQVFTSLYPDNTINYDKSKTKD